MKDSNRLTEAELHALADGLLTAEERADAEARLAAYPEDASKVTEWRDQNAQIRAAFAPYAAARAADADLIKPKGRRSFWGPSIAKKMAGVAVFAIGIAIGHYGPRSADDLAPQIASAEALPQQAQEAYLIYASEVRHPVEVFADEEAHLASWLGKRLEVENLKIPQLANLGFRLVGGRLLPVDGKAGALFMYEDQSGQRLTVMVGRDDSNRATAFRSVSAEGLDTFYWIDGALGYAVTGEISRELLQKVAAECYQQFNG
jgi:anti-sigma factor RsiW